MFGHDDNLISENYFVRYDELKILELYIFCRKIVSPEKFAYHLNNVQIIADKITIILGLF